MSTGDNKGMQFLITTTIFLLVFLLFYYFFIKKDDVAEITAEGFEIVLINDGALCLSDIKGENRVDRVHGSFAVWAPSGEDLYYIDNYSKLKRYELESKKSSDVAVNVLSFEVSPNGETIAFVENTDDPSLKIIEAMDGKLLSEIPAGRSPRWQKGGEGLFYIHEGDIFTADKRGKGLRRVLAADAVDFDVSSNGEYILFVEGDGVESRLLLGSVKSGSKKILKAVSFSDEPTASSPLGFSTPRFFNQKNEALFVLNNAKGGNLFRLNADDQSIEGVCTDRGPIFSLSIASDDDLVAYFYMSKTDLPSFKKITEEGEEGEEMEFAPDDLKSDLNKQLLEMEEEKTLTGDKVNRNNVNILLESDRVKIVDLERGVIWFVGSGQYPSLK
jgi:hypothetical protein